MKLEHILNQVQQSILKLRERVEVDSDTTTAALRAISVSFDDSVSRGRSVSCRSYKYEAPRHNPF